MDPVTSLLLIGSLNYYFGGSEQKLEKKKHTSRTTISDWDTDVQGPGFEHGFGHVLGTFLKNQTQKISTIWLRFSAR